MLKVLSKLIAGNAKGKNGTRERCGVSGIAKFKPTIYKADGII
jgi:hypothetical protein